MVCEGMLVLVIQAWFHGPRHMFVSAILEYAVAGKSGIGPNMRLMQGLFQERGDIYCYREGV